MTRCPACCCCCCRCWSSMFRKCFPKGAPIACIVLSLVAFWMLLLCGLEFLLMYSSGNSQVNIMYTYVTDEMQESIRAATDNMVASLVTPAMSIQSIEPLLSQCKMPIHSPPSYNPEVLIRIFNSFSPENGYPPTQSQYELESLGIVVKTPFLLSEEDFYFSSWEVAKSYSDACEQYLYIEQIFRNETIQDMSYGYCAWKNVTVSSSLTLNYTSPPLTALEERILSGESPSTFLPVDFVYDTFILTYESSFVCPSDKEKIYAMTFAQKSLQQLDDYMKSIALAENGVAYIAETTSGLLITSSVVNQTVSKNGTRVNCTEAENSLIKTSSNWLLDHAASMGWRHFKKREEFNEDGMVMIAQRFITTGIDWVIIVAIPSSDFFSIINKSVKNTAITIGILFTIAMIVVLLIMHYLIAKPLKLFVLSAFGVRRGLISSLGSRDELETEVFEGQENFCFRELRVTEDDFQKYEKGESKKRTQE